MAETAYVPRLRAQFDKEIRGKLGCTKGDMLAIREEPRSNWNRAWWGS